MTPSVLAAAIALWFIVVGVALAAAYRKEIAAAWIEPVLAAPVLIIESDDWGFGPIEQAERLRQIVRIRAGRHDAVGKPAVMTLGVVLGGPDTARLAADDCRSYQRMTLADSSLVEVRTAMMEGARQGVFSLQLHGMEHFWPAALLEAARTDPSVRRWLTSSPCPKTEELPAHLQSRWLDASRLPSKDLPSESIAVAAQEETKAFAATFGALPEVVVPPTFAWTPAVEQAWADAGVHLLITPGRRHDRRDEAGRLIPVAGFLRNGEVGPSGLMYLVRNDFFEPAFGHTAERGLAALRAKTRLGRPTLLETHRLNFIGDAAAASEALAQLDHLLGAAVSKFPGLRFMSSAELARHIRERSALVEDRLTARLHCFLARLAEYSRLWKLACASGLVVPVGLLWFVTRASRQPHDTRYSQRTAV